MDERVPSQSLLGYVFPLLTMDPVEAPAVVVLDFDAGEVRHVSGPSDPEARTTPFSDCAGTWPPYGDAEREAAITEHVRALFSPFDVVVTTNEPICEGPYVRAVIGPKYDCGRGSGYAEAGCARRIGNAIVFAKLEPYEGRSVSHEAIIIAHEVGHAFGLNHVDDPTDVMYPSTGTGEKTFVDRCMSIADELSCFVGRCPTLEPQGQNSYFGLLSVMGPARSDERSPTCLDASTEGCGCGPSSTPPPLALLIVLLLLRSRAGDRTSTTCAACLRRKPADASFTLERGRRRRYRSRRKPASNGMSARRPLALARC
jgi:hypothetical protein